PFEAIDRKFDLQENENQIRSQFEETQEEVDEAKKHLQNTTEFMQATNDDLKAKIEHVRNVKQQNDNFQKEMQLLKDERNPSVIDVDEIEDLKNNSETGQISTKITNLIQKSSEQKLKVMKLQLENEKKQSEKLNNFVKTSMKQIIEVDDTLKQKLGNEVTQMIEENIQRKLKVLELQLANETKQSQELNDTVKKDMIKISMVDKDIRHEKQKLQQEVKDKTERLVKAERLSAIGELAARIAHDLRNPLSVIKAAIELIKVKSGPTEPLAKQVGMIERSVSRMSHQIEDVLDFIKPVPLQLEQNSLLETINNSIEKANIPNSISLQLPEYDIEFSFDKDKLDVVFDNVITNAAQAVENEG
ncbi:MAG: histidine kinase dimerization/phospho-acceptor domain-containing protein, partial [Nitrosopumilaceae archaeon]|nr:histidine kinase dimerization/phospho-acceptor domain-containing protein [Nitrosopumilaceae archaeon]